MKNILVILALLTNSLTPVALRAQSINVQDSLALVEFYDSTNGNSWKTNSNWKSSAPVSWWNGVSVTGNRVTGISLMGNNVSGNLTPSFGNLDSLKYVYLIDNKIGGSIPTSIGNLSALRTLNLGANFLTGSIPSSLGMLFALTNLDLYANALTGEIPATIANLENLETVDLSNNQLSGNIPTTFADLNIYNFQIHGNRFTFQSMEQLVQAFNNNDILFYTPQANIVINQQDEQLSVSVHGSPVNNTFKWYKAGTGLVATIIADSTYMPLSPGNYYVEVNNAIASQLTLRSDVVPVKSVVVPLCPDKASVTITSDLSGPNYQWQKTTDGTGFHNLINDSNYNGTNTATLNLVNVPSAFNGDKYRCITNGDSSSLFTIRFINKWEENGNTGWESTANWSCGKLPDANTDVVIKSGTVVINQDVTVSSLKLSPGVSLTVKPGFTLTILHH